MPSSRKLNDDAVFVEQLREATRLIRLLYAARSTMQEIRNNPRAPIRICLRVVVGDRAQPEIDAELHGAARPALAILIGSLDRTFRRALRGTGVSLPREVNGP